MPCAFPRLREYFLSVHCSMFVYAKAAASDTVAFRIIESLRRWILMFVTPADRLDSHFSIEWLLPSKSSPPTPLAMTADNYLRESALAATVRSSLPCLVTNLRPEPQSQIHTSLECGEGEEQLAHSNYIF